MELTCDISVDGRTESVTVPTELAEPSDIMRVTALVGADPVRRLAAGEWEPDAASAIVYVNIVRAIAEGEPDWLNPPFKFGDMRLDWGLLTPWLNPDTELEELLAESSEDIE